MTNFPDSLLRRWETYRWDEANLSSEFGTTDVGDILRVIARWVRQDHAAAAESARLAEAVRGIVVQGGDEDYWEGVEEMRAAVLALLEPEA